VRVVEEEDLDLRMPRGRERLELLLGDLVVAGEDDLARLRILHVVRGDAAEDLFDEDRDLVDARLLHLPEHELRELAALP
jgi:hypothetical protein